MFSFEGFSCSLGVLYGGLGISKLQFLIKKIEITFPAKHFFSILGHQTLDPNPDPQLEKCWIRIQFPIKSMRIRNPACREPVPALLRDILAARQLEHVLGTPAVTFLQVPVPIFQKMHQFRGTRSGILSKIISWSV